MTQQTMLFLGVNLSLTLVITFVSINRKLVGSPTPMAIVASLYGLGGFIIMLIHRGTWAEATRYILHANVTMTDQDRKTLEWALATEADIQSGLFFGLSVGVLFASIAYFVTNSAKRDSIIIKRILGKYANFDDTEPWDFKAAFVFWTVLSSCILIFLWISTMIDKELLFSWVDVALLVMFSFVFAEWINWNLVFDKKTRHLVDRNLELKLLELRHRATLQTIHDLIYISIFVGIGLFISVIIPGAVRPSIMQASPLYGMAMIASVGYAAYMGAGFLGLLMQFWLELGRIERCIKELDLLATGNKENSHSTMTRPSG